MSLIGSKTETFSMTVRKPGIYDTGKRWHGQHIECQKSWASYEREVVCNRTLKDKELELKVADAVT